MNDKKHYLEQIALAFDENIAPYKHEFYSYCYNNDYAVVLIRRFWEDVKNIHGLKREDADKSGIGNNNEYDVYVEKNDEDGFLVKAYVAKVRYVYGIYGGCSFKIFDLATNQIIRDIGISPR